MIEKVYWRRYWCEECGRKQVDIYKRRQGRAVYKCYNCGQEYVNTNAANKNKKVFVKA